MDELIQQLSETISDARMDGSLSDSTFLDIAALITKIDLFHKHSVMQGPQFEELLQVRLDELPYTKHLDDGQYNDGQAAGFECGARWAYEKLSSGPTVADGAVGQNVRVDVCKCIIPHPNVNDDGCVLCNKPYSA